MNIEMKAVILNSGIGKRVMPFTYKNPKCLIKINDKSIIEHEIENLLHYGINDIIVTTGPFEDKLKAFVRNKFPGIKLTFVNNPRYESTNCIYSLWLTRNIKNLMNHDLIFMHGDMVFDVKLLGRLLSCKNGSCALVNNKIELPKKDFKAEIVDNYVKRIGVHIYGKNAFFLAPVYRFSKGDFKILMDEVDKFVKNGKISVYVEEAFNSVSDKIKLSPVYFGEELCMEIDDLNDLKIARNLFFEKEKSRS